MKVLADRPLQEIVVASADMFTCAELRGTEYVTAVFEAAGLHDREGAVDEFAVELGMLMSEIDDLKTKPLAEKLQAVYGWGSYEFNFFFEDVERARSAFARELRSELAVQIHESVAAGRVDAAAAALFLAERQTLHAAQALAALLGFTLSGKEPMEHAEWLERDFDTTPYRIEASKDRFTEWSDEMQAYGIAGLEKKAYRMGEMGLLKRWYELAPADSRLPIALAKMSGGYNESFSRRLHLFGLDDLACMLSPVGKD